MDFIMDSSQTYRLTLSDIQIENNWSSQKEDSYSTISISSPYVVSQNRKNILQEESTEFNNEYLYKHVTDQTFALNYVKKYFSSFSTVKSNPVDTGLLSPGLKAVGANYIVFEKPPTFKNIFYVPLSRSDMSEDLDNQQIFRIPIPWQLYFVKFNPDMYTYEVRMFFMNNSLTSIDQNLYLPPLPNFYTNAMLCPPIMDNMDDVDRYPKNHSGIMQCAYDWVWNSGTNHDLTESCLHVGLQLTQENSILKHMPELIYNNYFKNINILSDRHSRYSAQPKQIFHLLSAWEKSSLIEVCQISWPNTSGLKSNFVYFDMSNDVNGYYDHIYNFILDQDNSYSEEDVNEMVENGDYNTDDYHQYLRANNLIPAMIKMPWEKSYTYSEIVSQLIKSLNVDLNSLGSNSSFSYDINFINVSTNF